MAPLAPLKTPSLLSMHAGQCSRSFKKEEEEDELWNDVAVRIWWFCSGKRELLYLFISVVLVEVIVFIQFYCSR